MNRININEPRWDQSTYFGRVRHFLVITNPMNILCQNSELEKAKDIVTRYRKGEDLNLSEDELWKAKNIYDSAYHPESGNKMQLIGRMSAQVPMNMSITGCMLTFYKSNTAVIFWQTINQSFNAIVNHTNRSGATSLTDTNARICFFFAVGAAVVTGIRLNAIVKRMPPLIGRLVPFVAVATANCINIPLMRVKELMGGIELIDKNGNSVGFSTKAAQRGIGSVCFSRILMGAPGMVLPALIMNMLDKRGVLKRVPWISAPLQIGLCGLLLTFATPACCALFPQKASIRVDMLEKEVQEAIGKLPNPPEVVYYNKGL